MTHTEENEENEALSFHAGTFMSLISAASFHAHQAGEVCTCGREDCFWKQKHDEMQAILTVGTQMMFGVSPDDTVN
jgi:hypothetical protein